ARSWGHGTVPRLLRGLRSRDSPGQVLRWRAAGRLFRLRHYQAGGAETAHVRDGRLPCDHIIFWAGPHDDAEPGWPLSGYGDRIPVRPAANLRSQTGPG